MSDQYEYVDEEGNPVDPAELGDDVEFVDEEVEEVVEDTPAAAEPVVPTSEPVSAPTAAAAPRKVPKALLAGVAAAVLLVGGGAAYGLSQLGNQDTVQDAKAAVTEKTEQVKEEARADIDACDGRQVAAASFSKGGDTPKMELKVTSVTALPPGYAERVAGLGDRAADRVTILQQSTGDLGVYVQEEATKGLIPIKGVVGPWPSDVGSLLAMCLVRMRDPSALARRCSSRPLIAFDDPFDVPRRAVTRPLRRLVGQAHRVAALRRAPSAIPAGPVVAGAGFGNVRRGLRGRVRGASQSNSWAPSVA